MKKATVLPVGMTREGELHGAVQHEDRSVSFGVFRPMREGQPIHDLGTVCQIEDRPGTPFFDATFPFAEDQAEEPAAPADPAPARKGPARVNSRSYHEAWERIFGSRAEPGEA